MIGGITAIIPVKSLHIAKQRLAAHLGPDQRRALVIAMLQDVLHVVAACPAISRTILATEDPAISVFAADISAVQAGLGMNEAIGGAIGAVGTDTVLILPGDIPCMTPVELAALIAAHRRMTIVPARDETGTNALMLTPPGCIPLAFGPDSFSRHLGLARAAGIEPTIMRLAGIGLDIDTPEDLARCTVAGPHTTRTIREGGLLLSAASGSGQPL